MAYTPISGFPPQFSTSANVLASGYYVKFYQKGTTTPLSMATDEAGGTLLAKSKLNLKGYPISNDADETTVFVPHLNADYKIALYTNATDADANTIANADFGVNLVKSLANADLSPFTSSDTASLADLAPTVDDIATLQAGDYSAYKTIILRYRETVGDNAGGVLHKNPSAIWTSATPGYGGIYFEDSVGTKFERPVNGAVFGEWFGVSSAATEVENATALKNAIGTEIPVKLFGGPYTFDFESTTINYAGEYLSIDLGDEKHTFKNFEQLYSTTLKIFHWNGRITGANTAIKRLCHSTVIDKIIIDTVEVTDVLHSSPSGSGDYIFLFQWQHSADQNFSLNCKNAIFKDIRIVSDTVPQTAFGSFDSSTTFVERHYLHFENLYVENFFALDADQVTILDGESDFFRFFNNPTIVTVQNLAAHNVAKRFLKTQEECQFSVQTCNTTLDNRFTASTNHIATFEFQTSNQINPSRLIIDNLTADHSAATGTPLLCNTNDDNEFIIRTMRHNKVGFFSSAANILVQIDKAEGVGLSVAAASSSRIHLKNLVDTNLKPITATKLTLEDFDISSSETLTSAYLLNNCILRRGRITGMDTEDRIARFTSMEDIYVQYSTTTTVYRPFTPVGTINVARNIEIQDDSASAGVIAFFASTGTGSLYVHNFDINVGTLAFLSGGTWDVTLDNCSDTTVTGGGVSTKNVVLISADATATQLADATATINTKFKFAGRPAWDSTNTRPVWAAGSTATAVWEYADGTTAYTPA